MNLTIQNENANIKPLVTNLSNILANFSQNYCDIQNDLTTKINRLLNAYGL